MSTADLVARWRSLLAEESPAKQEVDARHPLRLLFGADGSMRPLFAVMTRRMPSEPDLPSDVVEVAVTVREDGFYVLQLCLRDASLFEVFAQLCHDLATRSASAESEGTALHAVYLALGEWKRLLRVRTQHLSLESLRGVVGELWCGLNELAGARSVADVFARWCGPYGAHQDFQFPDGLMVEVKSIRPGAQWVEISSEFQLEAYGHRLALVVVELEDAEPNAHGALSLPGLLSTVRDELADTPVALSAFESALAEFHDPFTHPFYGQQWFRARACRAHVVSEGFPRLTPDGLPEGVTGTRYRLSLAAIGGFAARVERGW